MCIRDSLPGVMTGLILAMARGAGEVAPLMVTGVVKLAPSLPDVYKRQLSPLSPPKTAPTTTSLQFVTIS